VKPECREVVVSKAVLPDGIGILKQKIQIWVILKGLAMEEVGIFMTILYILRSNGIFYCH
jgi:hypothetical protein